MVPFIAAVIIAMVLIGAATLAVGKAHHFATNFLGPPLSSQARDEIAHANCARLAQIYDQHAGGADHDTADATAIQLVNGRMQTLNCPPLGGSRG